MNFLGITASYSVLTYNCYTQTSENSSYWYTKICLRVFTSSLIAQYQYKSLKNLAQTKINHFKHYCLWWDSSDTYIYTHPVQTVIFLFILFNLGDYKDNVMGPNDKEKQKTDIQCRQNWTKNEQEMAQTMVVDGKNLMKHNIRPNNSIPKIKSHT